MQTGVVILAAGLSSRMGRFKPLLPLGGTTMIEQVVATFRSVGVAHIWVVIGHRAAQLTELLDRQAVRWILNPRYQEEMFTSLQAGVRCLDPGLRAFFILPVDIPLVRPETLRRLLRAFDPDHIHMLRPCYRGGRGHPPLLSSALIPSIADFEGSGGLRALIERDRLCTQDLECNDPGVLIDMDTRQDYEKHISQNSIRKGGQN